MNESEFPKKPTSFYREFNLLSNDVKQFAVTLVLLEKKIFKETYPQKRKIALGFQILIFSKKTIMTLSFQTMLKR